MIKSKFLKVSCPRCTHKQLVFNKASSPIKCAKCNYLLNQPTGGKTKVKAQVKEVMRT